VIWNPLPLSYQVFPLGQRTFIIVGNKAVTVPFHLNDLAGAAGRMDLMCRSVSAAFFLSHDLRRDVVVYLILRGEPGPPRAIRILGEDVKYMSPDERNIAGLIRKALAMEDIGPYWMDATPGIEICAKDLHDLLEEVMTGGKAYRLKEDGDPIEDASLGEDVVFVLGDHNGLTAEQEDLLVSWPKLSLGKKSYHTDHCITVVNHQLDQRS